MPDLDATRALGIRLLDELGREILGEPLSARGWTVGFDRARKRLGACHPQRRAITLSAHLTRHLAPEVVEDTLRHEIAHALDVEQRGRSCHDARWRALAVACGARPERCHAGGLPADPAAPYHAVCPTCATEAAVYRQPVRPLRCRACLRARRPAFLRVEHRRSGAVIWPGGAEAGAFGGTAGVTATCPGCGTVARRARRPKRPTACAACCRAHAGGRYAGRFRLRFG